VKKVIDLVPKVLLEALNGNGNLLHPSIVYPEIWEKLIEDNPLNFKFWTLLNKKVRESVPDTFKHEFFAYRNFVVRVETAHCGPDDWKLQKKEERNARCDDIIKLAKELAKKLKGTPFNDNLLNYFDHESYYQNALKNINESTSRWLSNTREHHGDELSPMDIIHIVGVLSPLISETLLSLSEDAKKEIKSSDDVIAKVNATDSNITYFVRLLSDWCNQFFGTPCHELVSLITDTAYDKRITPENVRNKLKGYKRSNGEIEFTNEYINKARIVDDYKDKNIDLE